MESWSETALSPRCEHSYWWCWVPLVDYGRMRVVGTIKPPSVVTMIRVEWDKITWSDGEELD